VRWYHNNRVQNPEFRMFDPTYEWIEQSLKLSEEILQPEQCANITTPILLCQVVHDEWVNPKAQDKFADNIKKAGGDITVVKFEKSMHEIFSMPNPITGTFLHLVLDYYESH
ncbi:MAG: alpha/beta hydrolase, partial [Bifidobacteriaceae bacterium]|nr:alpha/beta hydrolase [Bifidobacteriaceae bacterium]